MEKQANLAAALVMHAALGHDFLTVLSRHGDEDLSHTMRAEFAQDADLTISLHFHVTGNPHVRSVEAWTRSRTSKAIGRLILDHVAKEVGEEPVERDTMNRITHGQKPVVILVGGFISNPEVEAEVADGRRFVKLATGVRNALLQHYGKRR